MLFKYNRAEFVDCQEKTEKAKWTLTDYSLDERKMGLGDYSRTGGRNFAGIGFTTPRVQVTVGDPIPIAAGASWIIEAAIGLRPGRVGRDEIQNAPQADSEAIGPTSAASVWFWLALIGAG